MAWDADGNVMSDQQESLILYKNHLSSHFQGGSSYWLAGPITTCAVGGHALIPTVNVDVRGCNTCVDFTTSRVAASPLSEAPGYVTINASMGTSEVRPCHRPTARLLDLWPLTHATVLTIVCPIPKIVFHLLYFLSFLYYVWKFLLETIKLNFFLSNVTLEMSFKQPTISLLTFPPWSVAGQSIRHLTTIHSEFVSYQCLYIWKCTSTWDNVFIWNKTTFSPPFHSRGKWSNSKHRYAGCLDFYESL